MESEEEDEDEEDEEDVQPGQKMRRKATHPQAVARQGRDRDGAVGGDRRGGLSVHTKRPLCAQPGCFRCHCCSSRMGRGGGGDMRHGAGVNLGRGGRGQVDGGDESGDEDGGSKATCRVDWGVWAQGVVERLSVEANCLVVK